jgi:hypothetical protein
MGKAYAHIGEFWLENLQGGDHFEDPGTDKITLK